MLHSIKRYIKKLFISMIRAKKMRASYELAYYLKTQNRDFQHWSIDELAQRIADKKPVNL